MDIILGHGVFHIGNIAIGLSRGGGNFVVEKEFRQIEADGDRGYVVDMTVQDKAVPKLTMNALEILGENIEKMYTAIKATKEGTKTTITGSGKVDLNSYLPEVRWTGKTKGGKQVIIKVFNAINLENLNWSLADKDEVVAALTYTGCYERESPEDYEPWEIEYVD